jgi:PAS domain S-box-containing protein
MTESALQQMAENAALLLAMVLLFDAAVPRGRTGQSSWRQVPTGFFLGLTGIAVMLTPWQFGGGIFFDTRSVLLGICGLFFGSIPTIIAMTMTAALRFYQGGAAAWTGVSVILMTGLLGIAWRHFRRRSLAEIKWGELYLYGLVIHLVMLGLMFSLPWETALKVLSAISLPVMVIYPLGTTVLGMLMANRLRRERTADDLRENEERLRLAAGAANIGFFERNMLSGKEHYSPEWKKQIGFEDNELSDDIQEWQSRIHPDDLAGVLARVDACIERITPDYESEYRLRCKDGTYRWIMARGRLQFDPYGKVVRLLGCHIDVTHQKQIEEKNSASERQFRGLAESSQDSIMLYDRECRHVYENPAGLRVSGLRTVDIIGKTHREAGFSEELSTRWETDIEQVFTSGMPLQQLFEWEGAEGKVYLDWRLSPVFRADGSVELVLGISRDITALKLVEQALQKSEGQYRLLTENIKDVVWILDAETLTFRYVSPSVERLRGFTPEEILSVPLDNALTAEARSQLIALICGRAEAILTGKESADRFYSEDVEQPCKDGSTVWTEAVTSFYINPENGHVEVRGVTRDISERKQAEGKVQAAQAELRRLLEETEHSRRALLSVVEDQKRADEQVRRLNAELEKRVQERTVQLEAANKELEAFSYSVSHDLRAPLRALDGFSTALLDGYPEKLDDDGRHYLARIQEASRRMGQLITDLLNLSRVTRTAFTRQRVDLSALASEIASDLNMQDPQRDAVFDIPPGLLVMGDPHFLKIALENLLGNAFKFTSQRKQAKIQVGVREQAGERVYFVGDNGAGFNMTYADKLFSPFQRLHTAREFPGSGIGLATVQRIITRHGGRIWTEAVVDQGATIFFTVGEA